MDSSYPYYSAMPRIKFYPAAANPFYKPVQYKPLKTKTLNCLPIK